MFAEKTLLLDLGDTLVKIKEPFEVYTRRAIGLVLEKMEIDQNIELISQILEIRNEIRRNAHETEMELNIQDFLRQVFLKEFNLNLSSSVLNELEDVYVRAELDITELFDDAIDFLKAAKASGKKMYIVTNNFSPNHVEHLIEMFDLRQYFSGFYVSGSCGIRKPNRMFLEGFFKKYENLEPSNCTIIGDKYEMDILAGKNMGIRTCWINRLDKQVPPNEEFPDYEFKSLSEIVFS